MPRREIIAPSLGIWNGSADSTPASSTSKVLANLSTPFAAPATPFAASITADRNVPFAQLDVGDVKKVKDRFGVTVNDVVMALCATVLRWFLGDHGELPEKSLVAMVPVSVHDKSHRPGHNQLSDGWGLNITVMSLTGKLNVGLISCPAWVPNLWRIADGFDVALEELLDCKALRHACRPLGTFGR